MKRALLLVIILTGMLGGSSEAGNRYLAEGKKVLKKPRLSFPKIDSSKYLKKPQKEHNRYVSSRPTPVKKSSPRFSLLFSKGLFKRAKCYDPIRKVWVNADRKIIDGSVNVGKAGRTLFYRKGTLFCTVNLTD